MDLDRSSRLSFTLIFPLYFQICKQSTNTFLAIACKYLVITTYHFFNKCEIISCINTNNVSFVQFCISYLRFSNFYVVFMTYNVVRSKLIVCKNTFLATKYKWYLQLFLSWLIMIIIYVDIFS